MTRIQWFLTGVWFSVAIAQIILSLSKPSPIRATVTDNVYFVFYALVFYCLSFVIFFSAIRAASRLVRRRKRSPGSENAWISGIIAGLMSFFFLYFQSRAILHKHEMYFGNPIYCAMLFATLFFSTLVLIAVGRWELIRFRSGTQTDKGLGSSRIALLILLPLFAVMFVYLNIVRIWDVHITPPVKTTPELKRPNVVLITMDTLSAYHTDFYYVKGTTPTLMSLAAEGVAFPDTVAPMPLTSPSHASIITGVSPQTHGVLDNGEILPEKFTALAEVLVSNGYRTGAFVNLFALAPEFNFTQGFQSIYYSWQAKTAVRHKLNNLYLFSFGNRLSFFSYGMKHVPLADYENLWLALRWINDASEEPLFLWFHTYLPHTPYAPPPHVKKQFGIENVPNWTAQDSIKVTEENIMLEPQKLEQVKSLYHGDIFLSDTCVKKIVESLKSHGLIQNTLLIVTADHGETFQAHSSFIGHPYEIYEDTIRVPLIFYHPGILPPQGIRDDTVRLIDIMPTILDFLKLPIPEEVEGRSILPLLFDKNVSLPSSEPIISEAMPPSADTYKVSFRERQWKYIYDLGKGLDEVYNLDADPFEQTNLVDDQQIQALTESFRKSMREWFQEKRPKLSAETSDLSSDTRQKLKDLGYIR